MRATGMPMLHRGDHRLDGAFEVVELAHRGRDRLGHAVEAQLDLGDDAERALGADEQAREVVAGARLARAAAGADEAPVGRDDGEPEHVLAHRAVAHGVGARRARRGHAADRRVGARVDREEQAGALQLGVELLAGDAGLHAAVEVVDVDLEHAVHPRQVDADAAVERRDVAFERRADAERDHRHARRVAQPDDGRRPRRSCAERRRRRAAPRRRRPSPWLCWSRTARAVTARSP